MRNKASSWWYDLQDSLWFIPAVMTALAVVLALTMVRIDQSLQLDRRSGSEWLFGGGAEGARGVLSAIAGTMITVTGLVFSITIVALQLASSQLTPRVMRNFTGDRGNQLVLGVLIGAFVYSLLVLRSVRSAGEERETFVPAMSVTLAIVLAIFAIGFLIYFIHHSARSMQAAVIIHRIANDTTVVIDRMFPADIGRPAPEPAQPVPSSVPLTVRSDRAGYLQSLDADALFALAEADRVTIRVEVEIGDFLLPGAPLASIWPGTTGDASSLDATEFQDRVRGGFLLGLERTLADDVAFGFRQLADIAIKALSPGINDPTTSTMCIDRLGAALVTIGQREQPRELRIGEDGNVRLLVAGPPFDALVHTAFAQIRHYGAGDATVAEHLAATLGRVADLVSGELRAPLARETRLLVEGVERALNVEADVARVRRASAWALAK